jgi:8-oxo-dGTP diphosphatase
MGKRLGAAAVILDDRGRVLLVRHAYRRLNWELPGGGAEPGECIVDTAIREVAEETGLRVVAERLTGIYFDDRLDLHFFVFRCRLAGPAAPIPGEPEIAACAFWPPDALPRPMHDLTIRRIGEALAGAVQPLPVVARPTLWLE